MAAKQKEESRADRFRRLASRRTNDIIKKLSLLGNCSNRSSYDYSEQDINKIFNAIEAETKRAKTRFTFPGTKKEFKL